MTPLVDHGPLIATPAVAPEPLLLVDLLQDLEGLATRLRHELAARSWLNAYLLAAGMNQVAEDHLNEEGYLLGKVADQVGSAPAPVGHFGEQALRAAGSARFAMRSMSPAHLRAAAWQVDVASLVARLANIVISAKPDESELHATELLGYRVLERCRSVSLSLRRAVIRLPSSFRSFDQRPEDMERLVDKVTQEGVAATTPIAAVGVRTSGSYLAPIVAASLRTKGFQDVVALTVRPGQPIPARNRATLREVAGRGGLVLLVDDPPITGGSLDRAAHEISRSGVAPAAIVMLVPLLGDEDSLPAKIRDHRSVLLPWEEWSIHDEMSSEKVGASLTRMLGPKFEVVDVKRLSVPEPSGERGHVEGRFRVCLCGDDGVQSQRIVHVASVGLGYFGEHSLAVANRLTGFVPEIYGLYNGFLFRSWLPAERRVAAEGIGEDSGHLRPFLNYVLARSTALAVAGDTSQRLRGRLPVWEAASNILSRAFGRGWAWARIPLVDHVVRHILAVDKPAVVDGSMDPGNWFEADGQTNSLVKIDFDRRAFSNLDLYSYDAVFDVASLAADLELAAGRGDRPAPGSHQMRDSWAEMTGRSITAERWFLLQLVHLWNRQRTEPGQEAVYSRALARASQRYFSELFFDGARASGRGPLCALDIDGVLETECLGFSSLTASSAIALRALLTHGYRPVLVTGRSLAEVRDRCSAFGLSGGVAEYGSAFYDHELGTVGSLVTDAQRTDLLRLRRAFGAIEAIRVDDAYQHSVRVYRLSGSGERIAPPAGLVDHILGELDLRDAVEVYAGDAQVDLVAAGIDKGSGLRALMRHLGIDPEAMDGRPVALAVGDAASDIPMFRLARLAAAPAHAHANVRRAAGRAMPRPYQAGLANAVEVLIEHRPGSCSICAPPALKPTSTAVVSLLSAQERGVRSMVTAGLGLAAARGRLGLSDGPAAPASGSRPEARATTATSRVAGIVRNPVSRFVAHARTPLYGNGYALIVSTGITSALGLAYWGLAARLYSADAVGFNAAIISAMMFLAGLAQLNLMSALLRFMPEAGRQSIRLIVAAYGISMVVAALASVVFGQSIGIWVPRLAAIGSSPPLFLWFSVATIAWCIFVLEDSAITGLRRTIWVPISNAGFSIAKIVLLVLLAATLPFYGVFASWTIALATSILLTNALLFARLLPRHAAQVRSAKRGLSVGAVARYVAPDYVGSIFWLASTTLLPIIVAQEVGLRATAFFYLAWQIGYALCTVSMNMGYSLMVEAAADPHGLPAYSRRVLLLIMRIVVPAAVLLALGAPYVMRVFGADYEREGSALLSLLAVAAIPFSVVSLYVSVARVQRRVRQAALMLAFMCFLVLTLSEVFLRLMGLPGVGVAWLLSQVVVGSIVFARQIWPLWAAERAGGRLQEAVPLRIALEPVKDE